MLNETNSSLLENLDYFADTDIVVVTNPELILGFNYRAQTRGIALFIDRPFQHRWAFLQGLGRVGKFNDNYKVFKSGLIDLFDAEAEAQFAGNLLSSMD